VAHVEYGALLPGAVRVQGPDEYRPVFSDLECAHEIERAILNEGPETVAAVIGEPISAAAGVHTPTRRTGRRSAGSAIATGSC
jgi:adenosylmethionine-8-amino-7-oxononanoate aminotransferase